MLYDPERYRVGDVAAALNLAPCFTPVERHGGSLRQDLQARLPSREPVAGCAYSAPAGAPVGWIDDDNEIPSHPPVRMRSLRTFIQTQAQ